MQAGRTRQAWVSPGRKQILSFIQKLREELDANNLRREAEKRELEEARARDRDRDRNRKQFQLPDYLKYKTKTDEQVREELHAAADRYRERTNREMLDGIEGYARAYGEVLITHRIAIVQDYASKTMLDVRKVVKVMSTITNRRHVASVLLCMLLYNAFDEQHARAFLQPLFADRPAWWYEGGGGAVATSKDGRKKSRRKNIRTII